MAMSGIVDAVKVVDLLNPALDPAPDWMRSQLQRSLDAAVLDEVTHEHVERRAWEDDLTTGEAEALLITCEQNRRSPRDCYAPSQREIAAWIRGFCYL